jgi:hypothetical protein
MSQALAAAMRFDEYQLIISRVRQAVESVVPAGSTVLVASKGDQALLTFDQRTGWHFPRAIDGQYAGFHPADSHDAIARLDLQRGLGARYLVIPTTSAWWLDHYPELFVHVRANGRPLFEDASVAWIFNEDPGQVTQQMVSLLEALLPANATVAVVTSKDSDLIARCPLPAFAFRYTDDPVIDAGAAISDLRTIAKEGADFLVVPAASRDWLDAHPSLAEHIDGSYGLVTDQQHVCKIYDLKNGSGDRA